MTLAYILHQNFLDLNIWLSYHFNALQNNLFNQNRSIKAANKWHIQISHLSPFWKSKMFIAFEISIRSTICIYIWSSVSSVFLRWKRIRQWVYFDCRLKHFMILITISIFPLLRECRVVRLENLELSQLCDWSLCVLKNWMLLLDGYREAKKLRISSIQSARMNQWINHGCMVRKINLKPSIISVRVVVAAVALAPLTHRKQY